MNQNKQKLKVFFIKLAAITISIIIIINMTYNLIFAEKIEALTEILSINDRESIEMAKNKIREEIQKGLSKENILNEEDKILLYKFYQKIKLEFSNVNK